jgi:glucose-6-phosphate 1-dehydrogenase
MTNLTDTSPRARLTALASELRSRFVRRDEVEAQWDWVDAIRAGWEAEGLTPKTYTAGSWGPSAAIALAERDGVTWHE